MNEKLTEKQRKVLEAIKGFWREFSIAPSIRELCKITGLSSTSTIHAHLKALEKKGYIDKYSNKPRGIALKDGYNFTRVPLVGRIAAGEPIDAEENIEEYYPFPSGLLPREDVFMLEVKGESMIEEGIKEGDYVIAVCQNTADNGDIVVALLDGQQGKEATVKRFYKDNDAIRLQPANRTMMPIIARDIEIQGKVIAVFRRF